ncbi:MAG: lipoate--protein ligase family protein [Gemmatimonadales bacterium]|nr:MAG: lipoate--protein ligase family protein [Gemmatimonadales bacterium]
MAVDHALARELPPGEGVLRIYRWQRATLSFGRNQPAKGRYDPMAIDGFGVEVVRRPTGGREVLHDRELTYAAILPLRNPDGLRGTYGRINRALVNALRSLGVESTLAPGGGDPLSPDAGACFRAPAPGEVVAAGRKLVGSAQRRIGSTLLQHGSLLLAPSTTTFAALRVQPGPEPGGGQGISLAELGVAPLPFARVGAVVEAAMAGSYGGKWEIDELRPREREVAERLRTQYESSDWTWRR